MVLYTKEGKITMQWPVQNDLFISSSSTLLSLKHLPLSVWYFELGYILQFRGQSSVTLIRFYIHNNDLWCADNYILIPFM